MVGDEGHPPIISPISRFCSLARRSRAISYVTGPKALFFLFALRMTSSLTSPDNFESQVASPPYHSSQFDSFSPSWNVSDSSL